MSFLSELKNLSNIPKAFKSLSFPVSTPPPIPIDPATYRGGTNGQGGWMFEMMGGDYTYFKYNDWNSCVAAYQSCPPVAAIINRKAQSYINGKTWVLNSLGRVATSTDAQKILKLLNNPNPIQSGMQFKAQSYIYTLLFGFCIILPIKPFGFPNIDTTALWNIPANWIDYDRTQELFDRQGASILKQIVINFNGQRTTFNVSDLLIIRDFSPSFDSLTFPDSRLKAMEMPINNIIGAFESRNVLINYRGALGILTADPGKGAYNPISLTDKQKQEVQDDFRRYGLKKRQWKVIITSAALKWQQMGYATKDLMLMEEVQESTKSLCDGLNFPPHLLGLIDPTFNNQSTAEKGLYQNATIPDAENINQQLNNWFGTESLNLRIDTDFSHIPAMQEDKESGARARYVGDQAYLVEFNNNLITLNRWRELVGEDTVAGDDLYKWQLDQMQERMSPLAVAQLNQAQNPQPPLVTNGKELIFELLKPHILNGNGKERKQIAETTTDSGQG